MPINTLRFPCGNTDPRSGYLSGPNIRTTFPSILVVDPPVGSDPFGNNGGGGRLPPYDLIPPFFDLPGLADLTLPPGDQTGFTLPDRDQLALGGFTFIDPGTGQTDITFPDRDRPIFAGFTFVESDPGSGGVTLSTQDPRINILSQINQSEVGPRGSENTQLPDDPGSQLLSKFNTALALIESGGGQGTSSGRTNVNSSQVASRLSSPIPQKKQQNLEGGSIHSVFNKVSEVPEENSNQYYLLNTKYNFFRNEAKEETNLFDNYKYPNIFSEIVSEEVYYFLINENTNIPWDESKLNNLTEEKIELSLNRELLLMFKNMQGIANIRLNKNIFIKTIRSHLVAGTLDEFDVNYWRGIFYAQLNTTPLKVLNLGFNQNGLQSSLAYFGDKALKPFQEASNFSEKEIDNFKRFRFLLEDIEANIQVDQIGGTNVPMMMRNSGIPTEQIGVSSFYFTEHGTTNANLNIFDGSGYYFLSEDLAGIQLPLLTDNKATESIYLNPTEKFINNTLMGINRSYNISVSTNVSASEFSDNYDYTRDLSPMYFALDFDTVEETVPFESVNSTITAKYKLLTDEEAQRHSRNHTFGMTRVNLDYRDPFVHYAKDSMVLSFSMNEFNLRTFGTTRTNVGNNIMVRNIPTALIIVPGLGSAHNPYNGKSTLNTVDNENNITYRSIRVSPAIELNDESNLIPPAYGARVSDELNQDYFGVYEKLFDQNPLSEIYTYNPSSELFSKSYYYNGNYTKDQPPAEDRENCVENKISVDIVKKLTDLSAVESLTWWDVFRRIPISDLGKLSNSTPREFKEALSKGIINNKKINYVLSKRDLAYTGIPADVNIENDIIIIDENTR